VQNEVSFVLGCLDIEMDATPAGYGFISIPAMDPRQSMLCTLVDSLFRLFYARELFVTVYSWREINDFFFH